MAPTAFPDLVRQLAKEKGLSLSALGNLAWDQQVQGTSPDTLKKALDQHDPRRPPLALMEAVAGVLKVEPTAFIEYRLAAARRLFDERVVALDQAADNLSVLEEALGSRLKEAEREAQRLATGASPRGRATGRTRSRRPAPGRKPA